MSARVALLRMERDGLIQQPPPRKPGGRGPWPLHLPPGPLPPPLSATLSELRPLRLRAVDSTGDSRLWNDTVARHHYLGYTPLPGAQRRYLIESAQGQLLCLFGFAAAAWACQPRDNFIGWEPEERLQNLHLVVANTRFLILPWVRAPHLASAALGLVARQIGPDWEAVYGYRPALLETFVETGRFTGTSYRAANWVHVGQTRGRGKLDRTKARALPVKHVYLYPLGKDWRLRLGVSPDLVAALFRLGLRAV